MAQNRRPRTPPRPIEYMLASLFVALLGGVVGAVTGALLVVYIVGSFASLLLFIGAAGEAVRIGTYAVMDDRELAKLSREQQPQRPGP